MAKAYSNDLRRKLLEAHDRGEGSLRELAERFGVSSPYAGKISAQRRRTGQVERGGQNGTDPGRLVFRDETGGTTEMTRAYGRAPSGERVREATPAGHWSTLTLLGALTNQGLLASMTVESPTDGEVFRAYLQEVLCPCLQPGQIVIADNLSAHKVDGVRERLAAGGAKVLYLPTGDPDFKPI